MDIKGSHEFFSLFFNWEGGLHESFISLTFERTNQRKKHSLRHRRKRESLTTSRSGFYRQVEKLRPVGLITYEGSNRGSPAFSYKHLLVCRSVTAHETNIRESKYF